MSTDIAGALQAIASDLRQGSGSTLEDLYDRARASYLDKVVAHLVAMFEAKDFSVTRAYRLGRRTLIAIPTRQESLFGAPKRRKPFAERYTTTLEWNKDSIVWSLEGIKEAAGKAAPLRQTPQQVATDIFSAV